MIEKDKIWPWWPLFPLYPYGSKKTIFNELIPDQIWSLEQIQGIYLSYWLDIAPGGSIVLVQTFIFLFAFLFAPRYGIFKVKQLLSSSK